MFRYVFLAFFSVFLLNSLSASAQASNSAPAPPSAPASAPAANSQPVPGDVAAAEAAIAASDWKTAEAKLDSYLAAHPSDARALFDAGYVADAQNRLDDAASLYRRAIAADPNRLKRTSRSDCFSRVKTNSPKPAPSSSPPPPSTPASPIPHSRLAPGAPWRASIATPIPTLASNDLLEALKLSPETTADTLLAAELAEQTGQNDAAEAAYRRVLAKDPDSVPATIGLAHLLILRKQYPDAETLLRAALVKTPDDPTLTAQLATVLADQDKAEALPLLQKLHAAHPADPAITRMLAAVLADAGDYAGSDQLDLHLLAASPDDPELLVAHGQNLVHLASSTRPMRPSTRPRKSILPASDGWSGLAFTASRTGHPDVTAARADHALTLPP